MRLLLAFLPAAAAFVVSPTARSAARATARRVTEFSGEDDKIPELTDEQKEAVLYAVGINLASQFADLPKLVTTDEMASVTKGISDVLLGEIANDKAMATVQAVGVQMNQFLQSRMVKLVDDAKAGGIKALEDAAAEEGATKTESGLVYKSIKDGIGPKPTVGSTVQARATAARSLSGDR